MGSRPDVSRITGLGAVTALGPDAHALWRGALDAAVAIAPVPWLATDGLPFQLAAAVDRRFEPTERRALAFAESAAREAAKDAGWDEAVLADPGTALVVATTKAEIGLVQRVLDGRIPDHHLAEFPSFVLARTLAARLGVVGTVETVSLACASGVAAVGQASALLRSRRAERVLVVGTDALSEFIWLGFYALRALDPEGARPFDRDRGGLSIGEGGCALALERGEGPARAYLEGYGCSNDANHITGPSRDGAGLSAALARALDDAERRAEEVGIIECHGTGTVFNDAMEDHAYASICRGRDVPVHSIKGAIGHTMGAAGLVNVLLAVRGLEEDRCPPTAGLTHLDPKISLHVPMGTPAPAQGEVAFASASGFSGINAAVVLSRRRRLAHRARSPAKAAAGAVITGAVSLPMERASLVERVGKKAARRVDDLCLAGLALTNALLEDADLGEDEVAASRHALVLGSASGCLDSDYAYYQDLLALGVERANPRVFAYTLPNVVLGEIAIAHGWKGDNAMFSAGLASGLFALAEGVALIESGRIDRVIVYAIDTASPTVRQLMPVDSPSSPIASALMLEAHDFAVRGGRAIRAGLPSIAIGTQPVGAASSSAPDGSRARSAIADIVESARARRSTTVSVDCPSGYFARAELVTP